MAPIRTDSEPPHLQRNKDEFAVIREISESDHDGPVLMLNMNRYTLDAGFPNGELYQKYISGLGPLIEGLGAQILWRFPVLGQAFGEQKIHEILGAWYPSHKAFLNLFDLPGAAENFRLKGLCVEYAVVHRCPGVTPPLAPQVPSEASTRSWTAEG